MKAFIFQSIPERYDLRSQLSVGKTETWYATRYRSEMKPGDIVLFWMAGDEWFRGLYGWGAINSIPYVKDGWQSHGVDVKCHVKFQNPILAKSFRNDPTLAGMLIFRAPQASNFLLDTRQIKKITKLIREHGEQAPSLDGDSE